MRPLNSRWLDNKVFSERLAIADPTKATRADVVGMECPDRCVYIIHIECW